MLGLSLSTYVLSRDSYRLADIAIAVLLWASVVVLLAGAVFFTWALIRSWLVDDD